MGSTLNPYINFKDNAREALEFYRDALGGELHVNTFGEFGDDSAPEANLIMHGQLETPAGFTLMCSDAPPGMDASVSGGFAVSLSGDDDTELRGYWDKLSDGGEVHDAPGEADVGRHLRHVHRQVRRQLDGQHHRTAGLSARLRSGPPGTSRTMTDDQPSPEHQRPAGVDDATVAALGKLSEALEVVEEARGHLYAFHRLCGTADLTLGEAVDQLRSSGHPDLAERIERELVGRNVLEGRWSFQVVEEYDDTYYSAFRQSEQEVRDELVDGRRHLFEAEMKEDRRTHGHRHHEAVPNDTAPPQQGTR